MLSKQYARVPNKRLKFNWFHSHTLLFGDTNLANLSLFLAENKLTLRGFHRRSFKFHDNTKAIMYFHPYSDAMIPTLLENKLDHKDLTSAILCFNADQPAFLDKINSRYIELTKIPNLIIYLVCQRCNEQDYEPEISTAKVWAKENNIQFISYQDLKEGILSEQLYLLAQKIYFHKGCYGWEMKTEQEITNAIEEGTNRYNTLIKVKGVRSPISDFPGNLFEPANAVSPKSPKSLVLLYRILKQATKPGLSSRAYLVLETLFELDAQSDEEAKDIVTTFKGILDNSSIAHWEKLRFLFFHPGLPKDIALEVSKHYIDIASVDNEKDELAIRFSKITM